MHHHTWSGNLVLTQVSGILTPQELPIGLVVCLLQWESRSLLRALDQLWAPGSDTLFVRLSRDLSVCPLIHSVAQLINCPQVYLFTDPC